MDIRVGNIISFFIRFFFDVYVKIQFKSSYNVEKYCLNQIKKNFKCYCKNKKNHFPTILYYNDCINTIIMTHRGVSLKYLAKNIRVENYTEQINCILKNLKSLNLNQNDI